MNKNETILIAGANGLIGSAIARLLHRQGFTHVLTPPRSSLDLTDQSSTYAYLEKHQPAYVFGAAAKVGGIMANKAYPAEYCHVNLTIANHLIHGSYLAGVKKLLFLGSSCIYPKEAAIPIKEDSLLTGPLESTNEAYAIAKIAGVKLCDYYRQQYGCDFISAMPTNTFGQNDNYDLATSHMVAALIHKFYLAKIRKEPSVPLWGTGNPRRELLHADDVADAVVFLMHNYSQPGAINVGSGEDYSIREIAEMIGKAFQYEGRLEFDTSKPDGTMRKVMDVSRIAELGWKAKIPVEEGLKTACEWFEKNYDSLKLYPSFKTKPFLFHNPHTASKLKRFLIHPELANRSLDDPQTTVVHQRIVRSKPFLKQVYLGHYADFVQIHRSLEKLPGKELELGSGGGFLKDILPEVVTSDVALFPKVDQVEDATRLSFKDGELKAIYMTGVLHHIGRPRAFFKEAQRCLRKGGVVVMMEPHMSVFGKFFFKKLHHEPNDYHMNRWEFPQVGPLSSANTALPYLMFDRDREMFEKEFPDLKIEQRRYHTFVLYGLSGGVGFRFSMPGWTYKPIALVEKLLTPFMRTGLGTMQTITLRKV
jgi:GDP-L-fucose synthase